MPETTHSFSRPIDDSLRAWMKLPSPTPIPQPGHQICGSRSTRSAHSAGCSVACSMFSSVQCSSPLKNPSHSRLISILLAPSEVSRHGANLSPREDGPVLADEEAADIAPAAQAEAALHLVLHRGDDLVRRVSQLLQSKEHEVEHDGRTAHDDDAAVGFERQALEDVGEQTYLSIPFGGFPARVHGPNDVDSLDRLPLRHLVLVHEVGDAASAVQHDDLAVVLAVIEDVLQRRPQRGRPDSAAHE